MVLVDFPKYSGPPVFKDRPHLVHPIADRVALSLEIVSKTFSTNQKSAHGIRDEYQVRNGKFHENPGTLGF